MKHPNVDPGNPEAGQIRASEIIAYVLRERDAYPLPPRPDGLNVHVFLDIPDSICFDHSHWCSMSKTEYAKAHVVKPSQVSRWIAAGLPVRKDGRLSCHDADQWRDRYEYECEKEKKRGWLESVHVD